MSVPCLLDRRTSLRFAVAFALALVLTTAQRAGADVTFLTDPATLEATDLLDWASLGPRNTIVASPFTIISTSGSVSATLASAMGFEVGGDDGRFLAGEPLLNSKATLLAPLTVVSFETPVRGFGMFIQNGNVGTATTIVNVFEPLGGMIGSFEFTGFPGSFGGTLGTPLFVGALSATADIERVEYGSVLPAQSNQDYSISRLQLLTGPVALSALVASSVLVDEEIDPGPHPQNFKSGPDPGPRSITEVVIHAMAGYYNGSIEHFRDDPIGEFGPSAHYLISSHKASTSPVDGWIGQMLSEEDIAFHAGNLTINESSIGIELEDGCLQPSCVGYEGYLHDPMWVTGTLYTRTADLVRDIATRHGIPLDRDHIIGHFEVPDPHNPSSCPRLKPRPSQPPAPAVCLYGGDGGWKRDPGTYFDLDHLVRLARNEESIVVALKANPSTGIHAARY